VRLAQVGWQVQQQGVPVMKISDAKTVVSGALRGFCTVTMPSGMVLHQVGIFAKDGQVWAGPPSKQRIGRDGVAMKNNGKAVYEPVVGFVDKVTQQRWSDAVIAAVRDQEPALIP
jgi:hypothetical protein